MLKRKPFQHIFCKFVLINIITLYNETAIFIFRKKLITVWNVYEHHSNLIGGLATMKYFHIFIFDTKKKEVCLETSLLLFFFFRFVYGQILLSIIYNFGVSCEIQKNHYNPL